MEWMYDEKSGKKEDNSNADKEEYLLGKEYVGGSNVGCAGKGEFDGVTTTHDKLERLVRSETNNAAIESKSKEAFHREDPMYQVWKERRGRMKEMEKRRALFERAGVRLRPSGEGAKKEAVSSERKREERKDDKKKRRKKRSHSRRRRRYGRSRSRSRSRSGEDSSSSEGERHRRRKHRQSSESDTEDDDEENGRRDRKKYRHRSESKNRSSRSRKRRRKHHGDASDYDSSSEDYRHHRRRGRHRHHDDDTNYRSRPIDSHRNRQRHSEKERGEDFKTKSKGTESSRSRDGRQFADRNGEEDHHDFRRDEKQNTRREKGNDSNPNTKSYTSKNRDEDVSNGEMPMPASENSTNGTEKKTKYGLQSTSSTPALLSSSSDLGPDPKLLQQKRNEREDARKRMQERRHRLQSHPPPSPNGTHSTSLTASEREAALHAMKENAKRRDLDLAHAVSQKQQQHDEEEKDVARGKLGNDGDDAPTFLQELAQETHGINHDSSSSMATRVARNRHTNQNLSESFL